MNPRELVADIMLCLNAETVEYQFLMRLLKAIPERNQLKDTQGKLFGDILTEIATGLHTEALQDATRSLALLLGIATWINGL